MKNATSEETFTIKSAGTINANHKAPNIAFYDHQVKAMECLDRINKLPSFSTLVVLPTGGGKTLTASVWLLKNAIGKGFKVLWIAHRQFLLDQAAAAFQRNAYEAYLPRKASFRYRIVSGSAVHSSGLAQRVAEGRENAFRRHRRGPPRHGQDIPPHT